MELPHIGQTCVICNRNDYLPFKCSHCDKTVCIDHKTNHGYECPLNKSNFESEAPSGGTPTESLKKACDYCKKITLKLELVECNHCAGCHCLYHRHQVQHECSKLAEANERRLNEDRERKERQKEALQKLKESQRDTQARSLFEPSTGSIKAQPGLTSHQDPKKKALEKRVRIMRIKSSARGPSNILSEDKLYFEVKFKHQPDSCLSKESLDNKTIRFYTTAKHTIGRMIDWSAGELGLINKNHVIGADELIFMKTNDQNIPLILDSQMNFEHYLEAGQLEDGDELVMKYHRK